LESYLSTIHIQHIDIEKIGGVMKGYDTAAEDLDERMINLRAELGGIEDEVRKERERLASQTVAFDRRLSLRATVGVFSEEDGEVEVNLIYGKYNFFFSWHFLVLLNFLSQQL
jgi:hypothetical protein